MEINDIASAIGQSAAQMRERPDAQAAHEGIVRQATQALPNFHHVALSTVRRGEVTVLHASTDLAQQLDAVQYEIGEGPAVDALRHDVTVVAAPIRFDQRWPNYVGQSVERGVRSQVALRVFVDEVGTIGALNMYSTTTDAVSDDEVIVADMYAAHATLVLAKARQATQLMGAMHGRQAIGVAIGLLMGQYHMNEVQAKAFLWRTSSRSNMKVREAAAIVVERANQNAAE